MSTEQMRDEAQHQMVEYAQRMRAERDRAWAAIGEVMAICSKESGPPSDKDGDPVLFAIWSAAKDGLPS